MYTPSWARKSAFSSSPFLSRLPCLAGDAPTGAHWRPVVFCVHREPRCKFALSKCPHAPTFAERRASRPRVAPDGWQRHGAPHAVIIWFSTSLPWHLNLIRFGQNAGGLKTPADCARETKTPRPPIAAAHRATPPTPPKRAAPASIEAPCARAPPCRAR